MNDVQSYTDTRGISLDQVGVKGLRYRIGVVAKSGKHHEATATVAMAVDLPHHQKGTHMSRFIEVFSRHHENISVQSMPKLLAELQTRLKATNVRVEMAFPIFLERVAPITKAKALLDFDCHLIGQMRGSEMSLVLEVKVPVTSLCPCSKQISNYGAHNQRGIVSITVRPAMGKDGNLHQIWLEDLIDVAEACGSSPVYPLLKREDEKFVTEYAYENPAFVEDMARDASVRLQSDPRIAAYSVQVENFESIHNHSAYAMRGWTRKQKVA